MSVVAERISADRLASILMLFADVARHELIPTHANRAVRRALAASPDDPVAALVEAADLVGLRLHPSRKSLDQVAAMVTPRSAWGRFNASCAFVVTDQEGDRLCVREIEHPSEWIPKQAVADKYHAAEPDTWLGIDIAVPPDPVLDHDRSPVSRLRGWLQGERTDLWVAVIYSAAIGLLSLVVPVAIQSLVNTVAFGSLLQPVLVLTVIVLVGLGFATVLQGFRTFVVEIIQRRIFVRVSTDAVHRLLRARADAFDHHHGPELVNRFLEVVTVQKSGSMLLIDGLSILMQTISGMILLAIYHPWLLVFDVFLLFAILIVLFPMGRGAIATSIKESKAKYDLVAWLEEVARFPIAFKSARGTRYAIERTDALVQEYLTFRGKHFRILLRQIIGSLGLQAIASAVLLGVGGWLVIQRQLTLGQLVAAELIVTLVVSGFTKFGKQLETFYDLCAAVDKLGYLTDLPLEQSGNERVRGAAEGASIRFRRVSFRYPRRTILDQVDWEVPAGARIGITGIGKSTLFDLIYGLRTPQSGYIEVDGENIRDLRLTDLRSHVAVIREPEIFHGSIADNLRFADVEMPWSEMRQALETVGLLEELQSLPRGLETELQTGGSPLSPNQAARLLAARMLLAKPRVLILDELLDVVESAEDREELFRLLVDRRQPWTVLMVTKDASLLERCDEVYEVRNGLLIRK